MKMIYVVYYNNEKEENQEPHMFSTLEKAKEHLKKMTGHMVIEKATDDLVEDIKNQGD